jgi:RND family efflux transporter MFP subunit
LFQNGTMTGLSDAELLGRFADRQNEAAEAAFASLVDRYGAMVLRVCRGVLDNPHDAEDAFQATFLVLALRPDAVRDRDALGSWLFGVARRTANKAKVAAARRLAREKRGAELKSLSLVNDQRDAWTDLHAEVERLPEKYRSPIVLCYFAGLSHEEAAGQLQLPVGTVKVRLSRARDRLRTRLVRQGLAPALAAGMLAEEAVGSVPTRLLESTISVALRTVAGRSAGLSASVATLVKGMLRIMFLSKLKTALAGLTAGLTLFFSAVLAISIAPQPAQSGPPAVVAPQSEKPDLPADAPQTKDGTGKVVVETVKKEDFVRRANVVGMVQPAESVDLWPRFSGTLKSLNVELGDRVKRGQVIAEIDAPESAADGARSVAILAQAEARLLGAKASVELAEVSIETSKSRLETATLAHQRAESSLRFREKNRERAQALFERAAIDHGRVDEADEALESAKSAVSEALGAINTARAEVKEGAAKLAAAKAGVQEAEAGIQVAKADHRKFEIQQEFATITAPIDGIVTTRGHHVGDFLHSGGDAGATPIVTIIRTDKMHVSVDVPDQLAESLDKGDKATFHVNKHDYEGVVSRVAFALDPTTNTVRAEIDLDNTDGKLRPGQSGFARITLRTDEGVLTVPSSAIVIHQVGTHVAFGNCFRVVDGQAALTRVKLGEEDPDGRREILDGLNEGDVIIAKPNKTLKNGDAVEVE